MYKGKLGVAIISFNRPGYLARTLRSLEQQTHLENTTFHLFQDGAVNVFSGKRKSNRAHIEQSVRTFNHSKLSKGEGIVRIDDNVGNGVNQYEANMMMSELYPCYLMIEDDVLLSPHYLRLIRVMWSQFGLNEDIHSFNLNFRRECPLSAVPDNLDKVEYGETHWWAECMISRQWRKVRPYFEEYYDLIKDVDYSDIPRERIQALFRSHNFPKPQCSQDAGKDYALYRAGLRRLRAVVNRGYYIGEQGLHYRPNLYKKMGWDRQVPYVHGGDARMDGFSLVNSV